MKTKGKKRNFMRGQSGSTVVYLILAVLPEFLMLETTKLICEKLLKHCGFVKLFVTIYFSYNSYLVCSYNFFIHALVAFMWLKYSWIVFAILSNSSELLIFCAAQLIIFYARQSFPSFLIAAFWNYKEIIAARELSNRQRFFHLTLVENFTQKILSIFNKNEA